MAAVGLVFAIGWAAFWLYWIVAALEAARPAGALTVGVSTASMIRLARTYDGLMVSVVPDNAKPRERARRNVVLASGAAEADVDLAGIDAEAARVRLERSRGSVRGALR